MNHSLRGALASVALAAVLVACGDDDDDAADTTAAVEEGGIADPATTADTGSTASTGTGETVGADEGDYVEQILVVLDSDDADVRCIAQELVAAIGLEQLQAKGVTPEALAGGEVSQFGITLDEASTGETETAIAGCGDLVALILEQQDATPDEEECAAEHLTNEVAAHVFVATFLGQQPSREAQEAAAAFQACNAERAETTDGG